MMRWTSHIYFLIGLLTVWATLGCYGVQAVYLPIHEGSHQQENHAAQNGKTQLLKADGCTLCLAYQHSGAVVSNANSLEHSLIQDIQIVVPAFGLDFDSIAPTQLPRAPPQA